MSGIFGPKNTTGPAGRVSTPTSRTMPTGRTSDGRGVVHVDEPVLSQNELLKHGEQISIDERDITPQDIENQLSRTESDEDLPFFDALETQPDTQESVSDTQPLAKGKATKKPKGSYFEKFAALFVAWILDWSRIKAKVSLDAGNEHRETRDKLQGLRQQIRTQPRLVRQESRAELKALRKEAARTRAKRNGEVVQYLELVKALKRINKGREESYNVHLDGLMFGDGKAFIKDVDLEVTGVELLKSPKGDQIPRITADLEGVLEIPLKGKPPLRLRLQMTGVKISMEGRLIPAASTYIGKSSPVEIIKAMHKIRKSKDGLFKLKHFGIEAESIRATMENVDPETLGALVARMKSTRGRAIDKLFVSLGLPVDFKAREFKLFSSASEKSELFTADNLDVHYQSPDAVRSDFRRTRESSTELNRESRELTVTADSMAINTGAASDSIKKTIMDLTPEVMPLMPGDKPVDQTWADILDAQSSGLTAKVDDFSLKLGRQVLFDNGRAKLTGDDSISVSTGPLEIHNEGLAGVGVKARALELELTREGQDMAWLAGAEKISAKVDLKQKLPAQKGDIEFHGQLAGEKLMVAGEIRKEKNTFSVQVQGASLKTDGQPANIQSGKTKLELPGLVEARVEQLRMTGEGRDSRKEVDVSIRKASARGVGVIGVKTGKHQMSIALEGEAKLASTDIRWHQEKSGHYDQKLNTVNVQPGDFSMDNLKLGGINIGHAELNLDDSLSGSVNLSNVEIECETLIGKHSVLPKKYQKYLPEMLMKGRVIRLSMELPVQAGVIDPATTAISQVSLDNAKVDTNSLSGWSSQKLIDGVQYVAGKTDIEIQVTGTTMSEGALWVNLDINGIWIPVELMKIPGYRAETHSGILLPEMLHGLTGMHLGSPRSSETEMLNDIQQGKEEAIAKLETYCDEIGAEKSVRLLRKIDLTHCIEAANQADEKALWTLTHLYAAMRKYPEMAGKALEITLTNGWRLDADEKAYFCSAPIVSHLDPVILSRAIWGTGDYFAAYDIIHKAAEQAPGDRRLAFYESRIIGQLKAALLEDQLATDNVRFLQQEQMRKLSLAARLGHKNALIELEAYAAQGKPLAMLGLAGFQLERSKDPAVFFKAMKHLEQLALTDDPLVNRYSKTILLRRAHNSNRVFIHANPDSDGRLAEQNRLIRSGKLNELNGNDLYRWGLRFLYGIEGINIDLKKADLLLNLARDRNVQGASVQLGVVDQLRE